MLNLNFINLVKNNINTEAFVKFFNICTKQYMFDDCVLGLFAIKCKYLNEFGESKKCGNFKKCKEDLKYIDNLVFYKIDH